jgi:hypothetical protein
MNRGRPSNKEKFLNKNNNDHCVAINITISQKLLNDVERNIAGKSRSEKLVKCVRLGHERIVNRERLP